MSDEKQLSPTEQQPVPLPPENASGLRDKRVRPEGVVPNRRRATSSLD